MDDIIHTTYRLVDLADRTYGQTAASRRLAMVSLAEMDRTGRLGLERTDWDNSNLRPKVARTILVDAETEAGEWGANEPD